MLRFTLCLAGALALLPAAAAAQCEGITVFQDGIFVVVDHDVDYNCAVFNLFQAIRGRFETATSRLESLPYQ